MNLPWKLTNEDKEKMVKLFKTGKYTLKQIADFFGVDESAVSYQLTKALRLIKK